MIDNKTKEPQIKAPVHVITKHASSTDKDGLIDVRLTETSTAEDEESFDDPEDFVYSSMSR